jgi:putative ABC transport system substrate-binding protein
MKPSMRSYRSFSATGPQRGESGAEIPVEVSSKIELVINLKTAKAMGLTIPPEMLYRVDRLVR